jgi:hypothetical protein
MWRRTTLVGVTAVLVTACAVDAGPSTTPASAAATPGMLEPGMIEPAAGVEVFRELEAGTYLVDDPFPVRVSFAVPAGWRTWAYTSAASQINVIKPELGEVSFEIVDNISADPCTAELLDPPVGPSVDDLVTALSDLDEFEVSPPTDIMIDGYSGKQLTMTAPAETTCESLSTWRTTTRQNGVGPGEVNEVQILDVDGVRLVISVAHGPSLLAGAQSEIDAVLESIQLGS